MSNLKYIKVNSVLKPETDVDLTHVPLSDDVLNQTHALTKAELEVLTNEIKWCVRVAALTSFAHRSNLDVVRWHDVYVAKLINRLETSLVAFKELK